VTEDYDARIRALEAEVSTLRAEVARKDEALRQIADPRNWEEQDRARSIARAALGPWRPTHQSRERDHIKVREVGRGYGPDRLMQMVLYEGPPPGNSHVLYADIFGDRYRPLTPAEQAAYVEAAMGERT
jgi:hypothetical protein